MTTAFAVAYLAALVWRGFVPRRVGIGTWHMFASAPYCSLDLRERGTNEPFDRWRYLPRDQTAMNRGELELFLYYLERLHHLHLDGTASVRHGRRVDLVQIVDTHVVD